MHLNTVSVATARARQWVKNTLAFRRELGDLNKLTDRDLRDMGISRYDAVALAKNLKDSHIGR
jgi:uncharacterized protein YjiS (DUF1127 family)